MLWEYLLFVVIVITAACIVYVSYHKISTYLEKRIVVSDTVFDMRKEMRRSTITDDDKKG